MGKLKEQRAEKRLRYRWHARFASNPNQKPLSGQMVDVSSKGMALLYHADDNCPQPDQLITTNFGVPYFDSEDSFDTVFFNRIGRVCRVDNLTSKVNRIAIQFAEPLFFKPGEQNISDSDVKQMLEAKARSIVGGEEQKAVKTAAKIKDDTKTKSNTEKTERAYSEALARAEERIRSYAEAKAQAEEKLKTEIEAKARAEEKAKAEAKARAKAEAKAKTEAKLRAKAEKKAEAEIAKWAKIEAQLRAKAEEYAKQLAKVKKEVNQELAGIKAEAGDIITKMKAELKSNTHKTKAIRKKDKGNKPKRSGDGILMDKLDKFITDRNKIF